MKHYDVSADDGMVIDSQGSVWIWNEVQQAWGYITDDGAGVWDFKEYLPEGYEPYVKIDDAAQRIILKGLLAK